MASTTGRSSLTLARAGAALALAALALGGCKTSSPYIWVDSLPAQVDPAEKEYVIQAGDQLSIRVWGQDSMSARTRVRPDGRISLPFLDDVEAAGLTPSALSKRIQARLKEFVVNPVVTVSLEDLRPVSVSVLGEVVRPGQYPLDQGAGVLHALAAAGGMTAFADKESIYVIRTRKGGGEPERIRFTYVSLAGAQGRAASFRLHGGDVVVVE
jgi:polysaccharide export outer membrane protein